MVFGALRVCADPTAALHWVLQGRAVPAPSEPWNVPAEAAGTTLAAVVRDRAAEPWSVVKRWIETGKVALDGTTVTVIDHRVRGGERVEVKLSAPRPRDPTREADILYDDAHVIVIDKPEGVSSVPYDNRELGTAMDLIRAAWKRMGKKATVTPLLVVHRIDKATSGLLMFAKSKRAEQGLGAQLRDHSCERAYICVAHGALSPRTIESQLVADRGDGLRGSTRHANQGKRAVTHVAVRERLRGTTACDVRLETGKTHQIRIHFAEAGHPLVGEEVYIRDFTEAGGVLIPAPRLMLHAATLGFIHPISGEALRFERPPPREMSEWIASRRI
jgi:23S rRNA pseudouridine1911/1915/1917 synthase